MGAGTSTGRLEEIELSNNIEKGKFTGMQQLPYHRIDKPLGQGTDDDIGGQITKSYGRTSSG